MPQEFDPRWEYYTPDEEIAEITQQQVCHTIHSLPMRDGQPMFHIGERPKYRRTQEDISREIDRRMLFTTMWLGGFTYKQIMKVMGFADEITVKNWRNRLNLPLRKPGRHRQTNQVAYMKAQVPA